MFAACKKKEAPAIIEEVPTAAVPTETDTSATLAEEPSLKQVGKGAKAGSAKATFHPSASADKAGFSEGGHFVVQVSVFKSKAQAARLVEKLAGAGYPAYVAEVENPVPELAGTYHRVRVGNFAHVADAKAFGENTLAPMGYQFWVDNKKNDALGGDGTSAGPAPEPAYTAPKAARHSKPVEEAPITSPSEPSTPSEPSVPSGETWGTPKTEEPAAPAGETWGTPKTAETPAATPAATPTPSAPASKAPADTGKVNLDEW